MRVLILNHETYSNSHIESLKKKFSNIYLKNFEKKGELINFLKKKKEKKIPINIIFTAFGIFYDTNITRLLDDKIRYLVSPTTSITHIAKSVIKNGTKVLYLDNKNFNNLLKQIPSTAELTIMLILMLYRKVIPATLSVKKNMWNRDKFIGYQIKDKKIGIIGYGRIGKIVCKILKSFGAQIYIFDNNLNRKSKNFKTRSLKYIFSECDIISIHLDSKEKNFNFINKKYISLMKKNSIFINTSRGELIDEKYLLSSLIKNKIAGVGLDVLKGDSSWEKKIGNKKIRKYIKNEKLIVTPHIGGNTKEASYKTKSEIIKKLKTLF